MSETRPEPPRRFTPDEREALEPYFTNLDRPVFALVNLPEVVKGALFARYSRSAKSLRRLFLDEFLDQVGEPGVQRPRSASRRAEKLYDKVFLEYGDDSVAQLGGVHLACEDVSNMLTKMLEWGRLMAYLEQSTRYVPYTDRPGRALEVPRAGRAGRLARATSYVEALDLAFETYARWLEPMQEPLRRAPPARATACRPAVYRRTIRAKALDARARPAAGGDAAPTWGSTARARPTRRCCCACAPTRWPRSRQLRRTDARRTAQGDPGLPEAGGPAGPRRALERATWPRRATTIERGWRASCCAGVEPDGRSPRWC